MGKAVKGVIAGITAFALMLSCLLEYVSITPRDDLPSDLRRFASFDDLGQGDDIVEMALWELDYYQSNSLSGGKRYWKIVDDALGWTFPDDAAWCVCFVLCCAYQCGYIAEDGCFGDFSENNGNWIFWCGGLYNYLVNTTGLAEGFKTATGYKPVPGDLILFDQQVGSSNPDHIGIVQEVTEDGTLITIEGNSGNAVRSRRYSSYQLGTYAYMSGGKVVRISSYIHPFYPVSAAEIPSSTEATETQHIEEAA